MIKLDRSLVRDIDRDEAKRALVEMVGTFAGRVDAWLLAEGIERAGELATLADLRVPLAQGYFLARPAEPWAPLTDEAGEVLRRRRQAPATDSLRRLLDHPPVVRDVTGATDTFTDPSVDLVVLCDEHDRPLAVLDDRSAPVPIVAPGRRINVDTPSGDAALRTITRSDWAQPLLCTDNAGRYVGVVRIPRLLHALGTVGARGALGA